MKQQKILWQICDKRFWPCLNVELNIPRPGRLRPGHFAGRRLNGNAVPLMHKLHYFRVDYPWNSWHWYVYASKSKCHLFAAKGRNIQKKKVFIAANPFKTRLGTLCQKEFGVKTMLCAKEAKAKSESVALSACHTFGISWMPSLSPF